jgi:hypothetical protein
VTFGQEITEDLSAADSLMLARWALGGIRPPRNEAARAAGRSTHPPGRDRVPTERETAVAEGRQRQWHTLQTIGEI